MFLKHLVMSTTSTLKFPKIREKSRGAIRETIREKIRKKIREKILDLFAYTQLLPVL